MSRIVDHFEATIYTVETGKDFPRHQHQCAVTFPRDIGKTQAREMARAMRDSIQRFYGTSLLEVRASLSTKYIESWDREDI